MIIDNHVGFSKERHPALWSYIIENNIKADHRSDEDIAAIDIYSSDPHWEWIGKYVEEHNVQCLRDVIYNRDELQDAQWMSVRTTWRFGYPEPSADYEYENVTYTKTNYCTMCGAGLKQKALFRLKKSPNWGRRHFFAPFWIEDELFVSETAKEVLKTAEISGIFFQKVRHKRGDEFLPKTWQMCIEQVLAPAFIEHDEYVNRTTICPNCGRKKILCQTTTGKMHLYRKSVFENAPDIVKGYEIFGGMPTVAAQEILINQKAYHAIVNNKLDRGLMFYPIELV